MSLGSAATNISRHMLAKTAERLGLTRQDLRRRRFQLTGWQPGVSQRHPVQPTGAAPVLLTPTGADVLSCPYRLYPELVTGHTPVFWPPEGWKPRPDKPLEEALPFDWDEIYHTRYQQPFQPVVVWRNTIALCNFIEGRLESHARARALTLLQALLDLMKDYSVFEPDGAHGPTAWIENRFEYNNKEVVIPGPWVSGLTNAFAILACLRMRAHLDTTDLARAYANAYLSPHIAGQKRPARWISARDKRGYLWFEEYPTRRGRMLHVKNGHIFAVLALHELSLALPDAGYDRLVRAGATTMEAYAPCYRRQGQSSLYALNWYTKPDYLPNRAMRQLFQLYELTGAAVFKVQGDFFVLDAYPKVTRDLMVTVHINRREAIARRSQMDHAVQDA